MRSPLLTKSRLDSINDVEAIFLKQSFRLSDVQLRYAGVIWLLLPIRPLCLIGMWFDEDQRANTIKTQVWKRLDNVFEYY